MIKFLWVAACFALALFSYAFCRDKKDWAWLSAGMGFTLLADYFLVLYDDQPPGLAAFCLTHLFYFMRAAGFRYGWIPLATALCAAPWASKLGWVAGAGIVYGLLFIENIAANAVNLIRNVSRAPRVNRILTLTGLALFALCDVNVLLFNLPRFIDFPLQTAQTAYALIWVFYAPSQLLLAASAADIPRIRGILFDKNREPT